MERSLGLLKPDCLKRGLEKEALVLVESSGLKIVAMQRVRLTREHVDLVWPSCQQMDFYEDMVEFSTSGDSLVFLVEGDNALDRLSALVGHYDPIQAEERTIRRLFGTSAMENIIHSSLDQETYEEEKALFFGEDQGGCIEDFSQEARSAWLFS